MKWKNVDIGAAYYYVTGTFVEWLPLLKSPAVRDIVCEELNHAIEERSGCISAYVLMPDHVHLLAYIPEEGQLHRFNRRWRGRSARRIVDYAKQREAKSVLEVMARHANGAAQYAVWKEQVRALPAYTEDKLYAMVSYIHANPVRRRLVEHPGDWRFSSWRFYEAGEESGIAVKPLML